MIYVVIFLAIVVLSFAFTCLRYALQLSRQNVFDSRALPATGTIVDAVPGGSGFGRPSYDALDAKDYVMGFGSIRSGFRFRGMNPNYPVAKFTPQGGTPVTFVSPVGSAWHYPEIGASVDIRYDPDTPTSAQLVTDRMSKTLVLQLSIQWTGVLGGLTLATLFVIYLRAGA